MNIERLITNAQRKVKIPGFRPILYGINVVLILIALHLWHLQSIQNLPKEPFKSVISHDKSCKHDFGHFPTTVALNSFPGSGNTWIRSLIEQATGYYTGSVYMDTQLYQGGFLGEYRPAFSGTTIVQKIHNKRYSSLSSSYFVLTTNCIMLFRNPIEAMLAEYKRVHGNHGQFRSSHTLDVEVDNIEWKQFFNKKWMSYIEDNVAFLDQCQNLHVIFFSELQKDPVSETKKVSDFLSNIHERPLNFYANCIEKDTKDNFKRKTDVKKKLAAIKSLPQTHKESLYAAMRKDIEPRLFAKLGINLPPSFYDF